MTEAEPAELPPPERRIFCNRTLNMRTIRAVAFDMDYTLVHYRTEQWEKRAYEQVRRRLVDLGWPVGDLEFDAESVALGLVVDRELGNIVKANRFGYIKRASHGTRMLDLEAQRTMYSRVLVDLSEPRWTFMNTLFGLSEACIYAQLVDRLDAGMLPRVLGYAELYRIVRHSIDEAHMEGTLKAEIMAKPESYVSLDPDLPLALLDLKHAGKKLLLITNSEWEYAQAMMAYAFDRFLPPGQSWRNLFDLVMVSARKPAFFSHQNAVFEVVDETRGLLRPVVGPFQEGRVYVGGHAALIESHFGFSGEEILHMGDHIFADVHVTKNLLRWRTGLVVRELERELLGVEEFKPRQRELSELMDEKERLEHKYSMLRTQLQRQTGGYGPRTEASEAPLKRTMRGVRKALLELDERIAPLAREAAELVNHRWGPLMRAGNDKSHLARQIERYADIYTSRTSNLLFQTPFFYLRSPRGSLPHDSGPSGGV